MSELGDIGEDGLITRLTASLHQKETVLCGPGDDCAVVRSTSGELTLLKTDAIVSGVHFLTEEKPERVGWKAAARVVSDFAAMGGRPDHLLVTLAVPERLGIDWLEGLYVGLEKCARAYGASIVGGETTGLPEGAPVMISIAGTGTLKDGRWVGRSGGQPGDRIYVTGTLGGSITGKHLDFLPRVEEGTWIASRQGVSTMMDLSDGVAKDLPRLCDLSKCGFQVFPEQVPSNQGCNAEQALGDGEDYELMFTVEPMAAELLERDWPFPLELTCIGHLTSSERAGLRGTGWDHFKPSKR